MSSNNSEKLESILEEIQDTYDIQGGINHIDRINLPSASEVEDVLKKILQLIFPGFYNREVIHCGNLKHWSGHLLYDIYDKLVEQVVRSINFLNNEKCNDECRHEAEETVLKILAKIPSIRTAIKKDVQAAIVGDPAAKSYEEVLISYPGVRAVCMHRVAHEFYKAKVPLIDRIISEYAHMETGIDIHPGAKIGESFFIDHGTGVVIGETCVIGNHVKIYQMVTLGALSFKKDANGDLIRGIQRHPTIEDNVVLYAGCTILGGETVIGESSVVGGNVWITKSVSPKTIIMFDVEKEEYRVQQKKEKKTT